MIAEIAFAAGIGATIYTGLDHENLLPWSKTADGTKKWWWEKVPFVPAIPSARFNPAKYPINQPTGEQRIKGAQQAIGNAQRDIMAGILQQRVEEARQMQGVSKYQITS